MADYGVTDKGFVLKRYDEILAEVQSDVSDAVGFDVSQNPQSLINSALIYPFCDKIATLWEVAQDSYYAKYPSTASGISLDNACQYGNIIRKGARPTEYIIHCKAVDGTVVTKDAIISSNTNPVVRLKCSVETQLSRRSCNEIAIKPSVVESGVEYTIAVNGKAYSYTSQDHDTDVLILRGLDSAFKAEGFTHEVNGSALIIKAEDSAAVNSFTLTENRLTTEYVVGLVHFKTIDDGDINLPNGSINVITTNITGLKEVSNRISRTEGRLEETDEEFRSNYYSKSYSNSNRMTNSVESYVLDEVDGVNAVRVYENVSDKTVDGRPPHSIEVLVDGGRENEVASAILASKSGGIQTYGDVTQSVVGTYGDKFSINFSRPEKVYCWVKVELSGAVDSGYEKTVKDIILNLTSDLSIGDDFLTQKPINYIYSSVSGVNYVTIKVATSSTSGSVPSLSAYKAQNVEINEHQIADVSDIRIEVSLV